VNNILSDIVAHKHTQIEQAKRLCPPSALEDQLHDAPPVRDFVEALRAADGIGLIAEIKKASPSAGLIRHDFNPVEIASVYQRHGASCISVLTDEHFFHGHLDDMKAVRRSVSIPVMRKDFLLDRYQILEARAAGADCVLLIAECLDDSVLADLYQYATALGMTSLIEIYRPENLDRVLKLQPALLGVNNRNLETFITDLEHTILLARRIPRDVHLVSESGIRTREDLLRLRTAGVAAVLVGETLMRSPDIGSRIDELLGKS